MKTKYTRKELIEICEKAIVSQSKWNNRDSAESQIGVGKCWSLLKSGCKFEVATKENATGDCITNEGTIWIQFWVKDFNWGENLDYEEYPDGIDSSNYFFYLPTTKRLKDKEGKDWY